MRRPSFTAPRRQEGEAMPRPYEERGTFRGAGLKPAPTGRDADPSGQRVRPAWKGCARIHILSACEAGPVGAARTDRVRNSLDIEGRPAETRVVVAMSGGVDSSV